MRTCHLSYSMVSIDWSLMIRMRSIRKASKDECGSRPPFGMKHSFLWFAQYPSRTGLYRSKHKILIRITPSQSTICPVILFSYLCSSEFSSSYELSSTTTCTLMCLQRNYAAVMALPPMCASLSRVCSRLTLHTQSASPCSPLSLSLPIVCVSLKFSTIRRLGGATLRPTLTQSGALLSLWLP